MIIRRITTFGRSRIKNASGLLDRGAGSAFRARNGPAARHNLSTSSTQSLHTRTWDGAHRGLALPYPADLPLTEGVYEQRPKTEERVSTRRHTDDELAASLPDVILAQDYSTASKRRILLAKRRVDIPQHDAFEIMALRMLSRANNLYNKIRVNSFLVWWALIPDYRPSLPPGNLRETARVATINRIIRILTNLSSAECPNSALIRFGLLAARKGYSEVVVERLVTHVFMWSPPALSRKFLTDFIAAALVQPHSAVGARTLGSWYELAVRTQIYSGRYIEAEAIVREYETREDVEVPAGLRALVDASGRFTLPGKSERQRTTHVTAPSTPPALGTFNHVRQALGTLHQRRLGPGYLASVIYHCTAETSSLSLLHQLHDSLRNRYGSSTRAHWQMHPFRMDYWATAEMIYHLRYCNDPLAAFHVYTMYFHNRNFIPPSLYTKLHNEWTNTRDQSGSRSERMELFCRITGRGTAPSRDRARLMPRAHTALPVLWEAVARTKLVSPRELQELYEAQITNPLERMDPSRGTAPIITQRALRQLHTRRPSSKSRINIYSFSRPPIYQPSQAKFDNIMSPLRPGVATTKTSPSVGVAAGTTAVDRTSIERLEPFIPEQDRVGVLNLDRVRHAAAKIGGSILHRVGTPTLATA